MTRSPHCGRVSQYYRCDWPRCLGGLSPAMGAPRTDAAQRYLAGAYDPVEGLLQAFKTLRVMRAGQQSDSVKRAAGPRPKMLPEPAAFGGTVPV